MSEEIKILRPGQILDYVDTMEHLQELFNYITNLQKENERLSTALNASEEQKTKAIEYIKEEGTTYLNLANQRKWCSEFSAENILKILGGDKNESN